MLKDKEMHEIRLLEEPNGHIMTWGRSGQGKTYFLCRKAEEYYEAGKYLLILDYSGSYKEQELQKHGFLYSDQIYRYIPSENSFTWRLRVSDEKMFKKDVLDALLDSLNCNSYFQQKLLDDAIANIIEKQDNISIPMIIEELEKMLLKEKMCQKTVSNVDNLGRLLTRLQPYKEKSKLK